jgi:hypothetical protein
MQDLTIAEYSPYNTTRLRFQDNDSSFHKPSEFASNILLVLVSAMKVDIVAEEPLFIQALSDFPSWIEPKSLKFSSFKKPIIYAFV